MDSETNYSLQEAIPVLKKYPKVKFDESVEVSVNLGVDAKKSDQMVRGSSNLPYGTGKTQTVLVFCEADKHEEAKAAGADYVGEQDLIEKVSKGWMDFDYCIATPSMMKKVSKLGRVLGPRGLMPSPKTGSVTEDVSSVVKDAKEGKLDFKMNKLGNINVSIGKLSFSDDALADNCRTFLKTLVQSKPKAAKGKFIKGLVLSTTMGPGIKIKLPKEMQVL